MYYLKISLTNKLRSPKLIGLVRVHCIGIKSHPFQPVLYLLSLQIEVGYRMPAPTDTPNEVNGVMQQCWQYDPEERPDFATLLNMLTDAATKIKT